VVEEVPDPDETLCHKCGVACDAFPLKTTAEIVEQCASSRRFKGQFSVVRASVSEDDDAPQFEERMVQREFTIGRDFAIDVGYVPVAVAETLFDASASSARVKPVVAYDSRGEQVLSIAMKPHTIPSHIQFIPGRLFVRDETKYVHRTMRPEEQLREGQAWEHFTEKARHEDEERGPDLKADSVFKLQTFDQVEKTFAKAKAERDKKAEELQQQMNAMASNEDVTIQKVKVSSRRSQPSMASEMHAELSSSIPEGVASSKGAGKPMGLGRGVRAGRAAAGKSAARAGKGVGKGFGSSEPSLRAGSVGRKASPSVTLSAHPKVTPGLVTPVPKAVSTPQSKRKQYYEHRPINFKDILRGQAPTRQINPATAGCEQIVCTYAFRFVSHDWPFCRAKAYTYNRVICCWLLARTCVCMNRKRCVFMRLQHISTMRTNTALQSIHGASVNDIPLIRRKRESKS
jgi:hypothetical protein